MVNPFGLTEDITTLRTEAADKAANESALQEAQGKVDANVKFIKEYDTNVAKFQEGGELLAETIAQKNAGLFGLTDKEKMKHDILNNTGPLQSLMNTFSAEEASRFMEEEMSYRITAKRAQEAILTEPERQELINKGPIGFAEAFGALDGSYLIPLYGNIEKQSDDAAFINTVQKITNGEELTKPEQEALDIKMKTSAEMELRGMTIGGEIATGLGYLPSYLVEILATRSGLKGALKGAQAIGPAMTKQMVVSNIKNRAKVVGGSALAASSIGVASLDTYGERRIADKVSITDKGELLARQSTESPLASFVISTGNTFIEQTVEIGAGKVIGKAVSGTKAAANKYKFTKMGEKIPVKTVFQSLPIAFKERLARGYKLIHPNAKVKDMFSKVGIQNMVTELGEEYIDAAAQATFGAAVGDIKTAEDFLEAATLSPREALVAMGIIGVAGSVKGSVNLAANILHQRGQTPEQALETIKGLKASELDQIIDANQDLLDMKSFDDDIESLSFIDKESVEEAGLALGMSAEDVMVTQNNPQMLVSKITGREQTERLAERKEIITLGDEETGNARTIKGAKYPISSARIKEAVVRIIGNRVYNQPIKSQAYGLYAVKGAGKGGIRVKLHNDVEVIVHEMAHYLDKGINIGVGKEYKTKEIASFSYTAEPKLKYIEGFAEFFRAYISQEEFAKENAPNFYRKFEAILAKKPILKKQIHKLQEQVHQYVHQGPEFLLRSITQSDAERSLAQKITETASDFVADFSLLNKLDATNAYFFNRYLPVEQLEKKAKGSIQSENGAMRWWADFDAAYNITNFIIKEGTFVYDNNNEKVVTGKGLQAIFNPIIEIPDGAKKFKDYAIAKRSVEKKNQGYDVPLSQSGIAQGLSYGREHPEIETVWKEYQAFNKRMLDLWGSLDFLTAEQRELINKMNQDYIPFYRLLDGTDVSSGKGKGGLGYFSGGTADVKNLYANIVRNINTTTKAAMLNKAKAETYKLLATHVDGATIAIPIPDNAVMQVAQGKDVFSGEQVENFVKEMNREGANLDLETTREALGSLDLEFFMGRSAPRSQDGNMVDVVTVGGKKKYYEINDPIYAKMLQSFYFIPWDNPIYNSLATISRFIRNGIVYVPNFIIRSLFLDIIIGAITGKHYPIYDQIIALKDIYKNSPEYQSYKINATSFIERQQLTKEAETAAKFNLQVEKRNVFQNMFVAAEKTLDSLQLMTRVAEYTRSIKSGESTAVASRRARQVSTDYNIRGHSILLQHFNKIVLFLHPSIQGLNKYGKELLQKRSDKYLDADRQRLAIRFSAYIATVFLLKMALHDDEEEEDEEKRTAFEKFRADSINGLLVPKPFQYAATADLAEAMYKLIKDGDLDKSDWEGVMLALSSFNPFGKVTLTDALLFKQDFMGNPFVNQYDEQKESSQQYNAFTPQLWINAANITGGSPQVIGKWAAVLQPYIAKAGADMAEDFLWDTEAYGERPQFESSYFGLYDPKPDQRTKHGENFQFLKAELDEKYATYYDIQKKKIETGDTNAIQRLGEIEVRAGGKSKLKEFDNELATVVAQFRAFDKYKKSAYDAEVLITRDKNLTGVEKKQKIEQLWTDVEATWSGSKIMNGHTYDEWTKKAGRVIEKWEEIKD